MKSDRELDAQGLMCPMPIVKLAKEVKTMDKGQILHLIADDEGAKEDIPAWCSRTGNKLMKSAQEGKALHFWIRMM